MKGEQRNCAIKFISWDFSVRRAADPQCATSTDIQIQMLDIVFKFPFDNFFELH